MFADLAHSWLTFNPPVAAAKTSGRPLVALESTIIAHWMRYPDNVRTARKVEALVRDRGAEPATWDEDVTEARPYDACDR
jgi:pseudouridylate synthase